jgi:hypothetical protein
MCDPNHKPREFVEEGYISYVFNSSMKPLKIMLFSRFCSHTKAQFELNFKPITIHLVYKC